MRSPAVQRARNELRRKGYTQRQAAKLLDVTPEHLCYVLTDRRQSRRLLDAISALPDNHIPA